ncbi:hypothetical protein H3H12_25660 [Serratia marcescens]|nr:hypothetical protein [Serratia marcescens]MBN3904983.1 hypothetical protein [Serratia marcescens]MBN3916520.1 hypothetical protein [Serratia marcescens]MBN3921564.1 hypothetical protein [Serratia marcescens]MBN3938339.1 hypothetical protein [Serratia marcescens]MBN3957270.1 hypothetical protein [Serratia marcescens]
MKHLPLREVMRNLGLTVTDDGYELSNPAGTARYDLHGVRTMVNGIPEYFPITLSVKGGYAPAFEPGQTKPTENIGTMSLGINVDSASLTALESQLTRIADLYERIQKAQHQDKPVSNFYDDKGVLRLRIGNFGIKTANPPRSIFTVNAGQVFIGDALVKDAVISNCILSSELGKERQDHLKREVQAIIERELQPGGKLWRCIGER